MSIGKHQGDEELVNRAARNDSHPPDELGGVFRRCPRHACYLHDRARRDRRQRCRHRVERAPPGDADHVITSDHLAEQFRRHLPEILAEEHVRPVGRDRHHRAAKSEGCPQTLGEIDVDPRRGIDRDSHQAAFDGMVEDPCHPET